MPLGFYGSHSGQRYPAFTANVFPVPNGPLHPPVFAAAPSTSEVTQAVQTTIELQPSFPPNVPPITTVDSTAVTSPLLSSLETVWLDEAVEVTSRSPSPSRAPRRRPYQHNITHALLTNRPIEGYSPDDEYPPGDFIKLANSAPSPIKYPTIPRSTSAGLFEKGVYAPSLTQSFPSAHAGNPRDPEGSPEQPREDWYGLGDNIRSKANSSPASVGHGFRPPLPPPLALPEFIAPRPSAKQRYVSAGGTARLEDRPEIEDFVLPPRATPGITMPREILLQRLETTPRMVTPTRGSDDFAATGDSMRSSYEADPDQHRSRRDRKESVPSQRLARFRRVFSFGKEEGKEESPKEGDSPS